MKRIACVWAVLLTGCVVQSFHPFYTAKSVTDLKPLVGQWKLQQYCGDDLTNSNVNDWTFTDGGILHAVDKKNNGANFDVKLFKLGDRLFLNVVPKDLDDKTEPNELWLFTVRPTHTVCHVEITKDSLTIKPLAFGWLKEQLEKQAVTLPFLGNLDKMPLFTATAEQWEIFLGKYAADTNAFPDKSAFVLVKQPGPK